MCVNFPKACGSRTHAWLRFCLTLSRRSDGPNIPKVLLSRRSEGLDIAKVLLSRRFEGVNIAKALYNTWQEIRGDPT